MSFKVGCLVNNNGMAWVPEAFREPPKGLPKRLASHATSSGLLRNFNQVAITGPKL